MQQLSPGWGGTHHSSASWDSPAAPRSTPPASTAALRRAFCPPPLVTERSSEKPQSGTIKQNVIHHYPVRSQKANINYLIGVTSTGGHLAGPGDGGLTSGVLGRPAASWCRAEAAASPPTLLLPAATQFCPEMWSCKLLKHNFLSKFCKLASLIMTVNGWSAERAHRTALTGPVLEIIWNRFGFCSNSVGKLVAAGNLSPLSCSGLIYWS